MSDGNIQYLTEAELRSVLLAAEDEFERLAYKVAYWHALRSSEVCKMTGAHIQDGIVDMKRLKGSLHTRQVFISHSDPLLDEATELKAMAEVVGPRERLFQVSFKGEMRPMTRFQFYYRFNRAAAKAGLPKHRRHPHVLKHSIAMHSIESGVSLDKVRQYLGHRSIASTGSYLRVSDKAASDAIMDKVVGKAG